jgi:hypothetical protein
MYMNRKFEKRSTEMKHNGTLSELPWYASIAGNEEYWHSEAISSYPFLIAHEYNRLRDMIQNGEIYGSILQMKDTFEISLKFPVTILLEGCERKLRELLDKGCELKAVKETCSNSYRMIRLVLSKYLSLGDWERLAGYAARLEMHELPEAVDSIYLPIINLLKRIRKIYASSEITNWRNETIGHGALSFQEEPAFREDLRKKLLSLKKIMQESSECYDRIHFYSDTGMKLSGPIPIERMNDIERYYIRADDGKSGEEMALDPYLIHIIGKTFLFDTYDGWKAQALLLNYSHGGKKTYMGLSKRFQELNHYLKIAAIPIQDIHDASMDGDEIRKLESILNDKEVKKPQYMLDWLKSGMTAFDRGVFLLKAERGMGKSTFSSALDELDSCSFDSEKEKWLKETVVRTYHFNSSYFSRMDTFLHRLNEILKAYLTEENKIDHISVYGEDEAALDQCKVLLGESPDKKRVFAKALKTTLKLQKKKSPGKKKLLLILDGLDEIKNLQEISGGENYSDGYLKKYGETTVFDFIPEPEMLSQGVYILLTCRTEEEISQNLFLFDHLRHLALTDKPVIFDLANKEYCKLLREYAEKEILKEGDEGSVNDLLRRAGYRFIYLSIFKKMTDSGLKLAEVNSENLIEHYFRHIHRLGDNYYNKIIKTMRLLCLAEEALSLKELIHLLDEKVITFRFMAFIYDMRNFIEFKRSSRDTLLFVSHEVWKKGILTIEPAENIRLVEELYEKFCSFIEKIRLEKIDLSQDIYDAETWLLANMLELANTIPPGNRRTQIMDDIVAKLFTTVELFKTFTVEYVLNRKIRILSHVLHHCESSQGDGPDQYLKALFLRGQAYRYNGRFKESLDDFLKLLPLLTDEKAARRPKMLELLVDTYVGISEDYVKLFRKEEALEMDKRSIAHMEVIENLPAREIELDNIRLSLAKLSNNKGLTHTRFADYANAGLELDRAVGIVRSLKNRVLEGQYLNNRGVYFLKMRQYEAALKDFEDSRKIREALADEERRRQKHRRDYTQRIALVNVYVNIGIALSGLNRFEDAEQYFLKMAPKKINALKFVQQIKENNFVEEYMQYHYALLLMKQALQADRDAWRRKGLNEAVAVFQDTIDQRMGRIGVGPQSGDFFRLYNDKGYAHFCLEEFDKSMDCYSAASIKLEEIKLNDRGPYEGDMAIFYARWALSRLKKGQYALASQSMLTSLDLAARMHNEGRFFNKYDVALAYRNIIGAYGEYGASEIFGSNSTDLMNSIKNVEARQLLETMLVTVEEAAITRESQE